MGIGSVIVIIVIIDVIISIFIIDIFLNRDVRLLMMEVADEVEIMFG